ncbi:MAG TPA: class I SAM-dependent methyltransferase [Jatrophihabitantaceae bacterium]
MVAETAEDTGFAAVWAHVRGIPGWLTQAQALALWQAASATPAPGVIVEIGSHQGRSTIVLAAAGGRRVVAIDPFVDGRLFGGAPTRDKFAANIAAAGVAVELIAEPSTRVRPTWREPIDLLYVDGKHDYWTVGNDLRWTAHVRPRGTVLVHDAYSSIGVTLALLRHVLFGRGLRYLGRVGSLARFEVAPPGTRDRLRMLGELPWWLRNVAIKLVLRAGRLFGHRSTPDPY